MAGRGGAREGAGRPKLYDELETKTVTLDRATIEYIYTYRGIVRDGGRDINFSEALRELIGVLRDQAS